MRAFPIGPLPRQMGDVKAAVQVDPVAGVQCRRLVPVEAKQSAEGRPAAVVFHLNGIKIIHIGRALRRWRAPGLALDRTASHSSASAASPIQSMWSSSAEPGVVGLRPPQVVRHRCRVDRESVEQAGLEAGEPGGSRYSGSKWACNGRTDRRAGRGSRRRGSPRRVPRRSSGRGKTCRRGSGAWPRLPFGNAHQGERQAAQLSHENAGVQRRPRTCVS